VVVSSDETVFSAVNYRGFPRQLTTAGFAIPWQLTVKGQYSILLVCFSRMIRVNNNFPCILLASFFLLLLFSYNNY